MQAVLRQLLHPNPDMRVGGMQGYSFADIEEFLTEGHHW